jgi:hypothetical protein
MDADLQGNDAEVIWIMERGRPLYHQFDLCEWDSPDYV